MLNRFKAEAMDPRGASRAINYRGELRFMAVLPQNLESYDARPVAVAATIAAPRPERARSYCKTTNSSLFGPPKR